MLLLLPWFYEFAFQVRLYRPRRTGPGFGHLVFQFFGPIPPWRNWQYFVQSPVPQSDAAALLPCEVEWDALSDISSDDERKIRDKLGQAPWSYLFAFQRKDGRLLIGTRQAVAGLLRRYVDELNDTPFVLHDVAEFVGDSRLIEVATRLSAAAFDETRRTGNA